MIIPKNCPLSFTVGGTVAIKSRPNPLYKKEYANRIATGNFDDDFEKIKDADWIIEVIVENLEIKKTVFEKVEKFKSDHAFVTSNTSSIPISLLCEGRSDNFKSKFCGTHFFNPPRYLRLFEVIPHDDTDPSLTSFLMEFGDLVLGKQTVLCKDTPGFIGNRIGVMSGIKVLQLTEKYNFLDASCCNVEVVKGAAGLFLAGFFFMSLTLNSALIFC